MENKIKTILEIKEVCNNSRSEGKKIVTTNGSFDILHIGHVRYLQEAKKSGDVLIILLNSDSSVKSLKGDKRPIIPEQERAEMLASLECVDYVVIFSEDKPLDLLKEVKPNFHVKGGTFVPERIKEEKDLIESWGGKHITLPEIKGLSTTNVINKILDSYKDD
jgi:rfaE bifunctional protein nucleotidyltransferase chain/domain